MEENYTVLLSYPWDQFMKNHVISLPTVNYSSTLRSPFSNASNQSNDLDKKAIRDAIRQVFPITIKQLKQSYLELKVPRMVVEVIETNEAFDHSYRLILQDESGRMEGFIASDSLFLWPMIITIGTVIVLEKVSIFVEKSNSLSIGYVSYLNITKDNIIAVFSPNTVTASITDDNKNSEN